MLLYRQTTPNFAVTSCVLRVFRSDCQAQFNSRGSQERFCALRLNWLPPGTKSLVQSVHGISLPCFKGISRLTL